MGKKGYIFFVLSLFLWICCFNYFGYSSEVIYVKNSEQESISDSILKLTSKFYGLDIYTINLKKSKEYELLNDALDKRDINAIVISAQAFPILDKKKVYSILKNYKRGSLPLLILDISTENDFEIREWSQRKIECNKETNFSLAASFKISNFKNVSRELSNQGIRVKCKELYYFKIKNSKKTKSLIYINKKKKKLESYPLFISYFNEGQEIFFLTRYPIEKSSKLTINKSYHDLLLSGEKINKYFIIRILPVMMFLRYACDQRCWHSAGNFANLTIDDPWLIDSYGYLSYSKLYNEIINKNFHTTIGFIPWNFDRSESNVVKLFNNYPDKLSICIHGNNHDHYEFYKYKTNSKDPWPAKPLNIQEVNIRQAVARMERFEELTGLNYDKVMIFPHGIAPERTLGLLKKYNFLATVNDNNVPLDAREPENPFFDLRSVTLEYGNFPSFKRYSQERSEFEIALDLFLDNPLLFYVHQDYFKKGINAFNRTAEVVNSIQPDITWQSLGYICKHYYLEKLRDDGGYDIKVFTNNFIIENKHNRDVTYYVRKEESFSIPIKQVTVDGESYSYERANDKLILKLSIPKGESREVFIEYENNLDLASVDISKNDPRVNRLRKVSDFRDMTLSKNVFGRIIISIYYDTGLYKSDLRKLVALSLVLSIFAIAGTIYLIKLRRKHKA